MNVIKIKQFDLRVTDFHELFREKIEADLWHDLKKFGLIEESVLKMDSKKFFYHHVFLRVIEHLLEKGDGKNIIYMCETDTDFGGLEGFFNKDDLITLNKQIMRKMVKTLPVKVYFTKEPFSSFCEDHNRNNGSLRSIALKMNRLVEKTKIENFTFQSIKSFTKRYGLTFLNEKIFNEIRTKQIIFS